ncbi:MULTISPECIES: hypothetical protein, partial [unclassified Microcoleus]|uniref:hypothetical protein n=1 Tax=unclassified Microcoleus TaxID=2642155 RepID=UPI002FD64E94
TIVIYICSGAVYGIIDAWRNKTSLAQELNQLINSFKQNKFWALGTVVAFLWAAFQYCGCVFWYDFNTHDDYHAYFVFPHKMLQIGALGSDPFSERRLVSALGGQSFLHTFILSVLDERSLYLLDPGCALLVMIGLAIGYCQKKNLSKNSTLMIVFGFLSLNLVRINITGVLIPACLFFSLFNVLECERLKATNIPNNAAIVGLLAGAICALKTTLIPACIILFASSYLFYILGTKKKQKAISEFCLAAILLAAFILPWSISMYQSSGTLLYPIFGKGFHGSVYGGSVKLPNSEIPPDIAIKLRMYAILAIIYISAVLGIRFGLIGIRKKPIVREATLSILISTVAGTAIIAFSTGASDVYRYAYSLLLVMFVVFILIFVEYIEKQNNLNFNFKKIAFSSAVFLSLLVARYSHGYNGFTEYKDFINSINRGLNNVPLVTPQERERYAKMLDSIPERAIVLTRLDKPFLLNFKQHTIWIADYPGGASLPPGMPSFKGEEALANYLVSQSIRYVAYSYGNEANFPRKYLEVRLLPNSPFWMRNQALNALEFQDNLQKLGETRKRIYDEGGNFVIDLLSSQKQQ